MTKILLPLVVFAIAGFMIYKVWNGNKASKENFAIGQTYLLENAEKDNVVTTESGLQYLILSEGSGDEKPLASSTVTVHYTGKLLDGTVFDSSVERGEPISFKLKRVIKGWQEGLMYMTEGQKMRLFIPSTLAYGNTSTGPIPAGSTLIFDVELIKITN
ncbi:FKBP-type peptidyl-prolyl cis-trans isomerase [Vibrio sp.]|nr:FKBP-type peptidyl-prolyl cis-trans isomerase [Vibrio sp.]